MYFVHKKPDPKLTDEASVKLSFQQTSEYYFVAANLDQLV